jgi:hypothetical protein
MARDNSSGVLDLTNYQSMCEATLPYRTVNRRLISTDHTLRTVLFSATICCRDVQFRSYGAVNGAKPLVHLVSKITLYPLAIYA